MDIHSFGARVKSKWLKNMIMMGRRQTARQTHKLTGETHTQTDRTDNQTDTQTDRTDNQTDTQTDS